MSISEVKKAIETGDAEGLRDLLAAAPAMANATLRWGEGDKNGSVPLHFVSDMLFQGSLLPGQGLPLVEVLLATGADINAPHERHGETPLIGAASLYAEEIGIRLVAAGADVRATGLFGATALHWAAQCGLERLTQSLIEAGAKVDQRDEKFEGTPVAWAVHGWLEGPPERPRGQPRAARLLVEAGAPEDELTRVADDEKWRSAADAATV